MELDYIIEQMIQEYRHRLPEYQKMLDYYIGNHDILLTNSKATVQNFVSLFINEELDYALSNPITYVSKTGDVEILNAIENNMFHWKITENRELMKNLEIFSKAYTLFYTDKQGRFCERLLTPLNAIEYVVDDEIKIFIHFYKKKYDEDEYYDIYFKDRIEIYKEGVLINTKPNIFKAVPVSMCNFEDISETIFYKIKSLNDAYNNILSGNVEIINTYKNAYLIITGVEVDDEVAKSLKEKGLLNLKSKDGEVKWLVKDVPSDYIENTLDTLRQAMFSSSSHVDSQERLQSNNSGVALRSRLVFLEERVKSIFNVVCDSVYDRLEFLFKYLALKNEYYDVKDININFVPAIPQDVITTVQTITQLGDKLSLETALSLLPFIESPATEIEKIKKERKELEEIDLDKINGLE